MKWLALKLIRFYQIVLSPHLLSSCKFYPTCSEYTILAIQKYGIVKGSYKGFRRIMRCNPCNHPLTRVDEP